MSRSGRQAVWALWGNGWVALLMVLAVGCALTPPEPDKSYLLDAGGGPSRSAVHHRSDRVLVVAEPQAMPGFDSPSIAYIRTPLALEYYTKSQWIDTPARMLAPLVVKALMNAGGFRAVVAEPTPVEGDLRLEIDSLWVQQEFLQQPSRVRFAFRASLVDVASNRVSATRAFEVMETAPSEDAYGGVQAANIAAERLLAELTDFMAQQAW